MAPDTKKPSANNATISHKAIRRDTGAIRCIRYPRLSI
jgi:hypothetical protein